MVREECSPNENTRVADKQPTNGTHISVFPVFNVFLCILYAPPFPGNGSTDKVVIIVVESESDKFEDQMVSECQVSSSGDIMGRASEDVNDNMEDGAIDGRKEIMVVGGNDSMSGASENGSTIEAGGDVIVDGALISDDIFNKTTESENGGTVSSGTKGESNDIVGGTAEGYIENCEGKH